MPKQRTDPFTTIRKSFRSLLNVSPPRHHVPSLSNRTRSIMSTLGTSWTSSLGEATLALSFPNP